MRTEKAWSFVYVCVSAVLKMKGVFVMSSSLHDILFMTVDNELRRHYHQVAVKQELCQVTCDGCCYSSRVMRLT